MHVVLKRRSRSVKFRLSFAFLMLRALVALVLPCSSAALVGPPPARPIAADPRPSDFAITGAPQVLSFTAAPRKPVFLFVPGIELTGYSLHRQIDELATDYEVRCLTVPRDDRSSFDELCSIVAVAVEEAAADVATAGAATRSVILAGESFGGVLALAVALRDLKPPPGLSGLVLINPATSIARSWSSQLPKLLSTISSLPDGLSDATYAALAAPIIAYISGDPMRLGARREDASRPPPLRSLSAMGRLGSSLPLLLSLPDALPREALSYRLPMLLDAAKQADGYQLSRLRLPVDRDHGLHSISARLT